MPQGGNPRQEAVGWKSYGPGLDGKAEWDPYDHVLGSQLVFKNGVPGPRTQSFLPSFYCRTIPGANINGWNQKTLT